MEYKLDQKHLHNTYLSDIVTLNGRRIGNHIMKGTLANQYSIGHKLFLIYIGKQNGKIA